MKLALIIGLVQYHFFFASANNLGIRVLLNKGSALATGEICSDQEWSNITTTIDGTLKGSRRSLRQLNSFPSWCAEKCKGFVKNHCTGQHYKCDGYRRLQVAPAPAIAPAPATAPVSPPITSCEDGISKVNLALTTLAPAVSPECRAVIMAPRELTCLTTIDDCHIQKIRLMNSDNDSVMVDNFQSGMSFNNTGPKITFEAINDKCVCNVQFFLKNSAGTVIQNRFEFYRPFVLYSNSAPNAQTGLVNLFGARLAPGTYTLEYYPDSKPATIRTIAFTVNNY